MRSTLMRYKLSAFYRFICALSLVIVMQACVGKPKVYKSNCDPDIKFKQVDFTRLIDSVENYDQQYIEVDGTYIEGKGESALVNDSTFADHSSKHAIWVNFNQDCPLYLEGTRKGLFEFNDGTFTQINSKKITIRGRIDVKRKGNLKGYKASMDRISFVKL